MNSRLYELLRKYEHRGISLYDHEGDMTTFELDPRTWLDVTIPDQGECLVNVYRIYGVNALSRLVTTDVEEAYAEVEEAYAEVERWFSGVGG